MHKIITCKMFIIIILQISTCLTITSTLGLAQENSLVFQGRVFQGEVGDESRPLPKVLILVYGSNVTYPILDSLIAKGTLIARAQTDNRGWFRLVASTGFKLYSIIETDPPGYVSVGARTVSGKVRTNNWILFSNLKDDMTLTGNKFWDKRSSSSQERIRPHIEAVVPKRGNRGQELALTIRGNNFIPATIVTIPAIDVLNTQFINSNELRVTIAIHPNSPLGTRYIKVVNAEELEDVLKDGFTVQDLQQPDLKISFNQWRIVEDGRVLLILVDIQNIGNRGAPGTVVRAEEPARDWFSENFPVPELKPNEGVPVEISLPISDDRRGMTHTFRVKVAPVNESNEDNNVTRAFEIPIESKTTIVGERQVIVPRVINSKINVAKELIEQTGLRVGELEGNIDDPEAIVTNQYPPAGTEVLINTPVNLVLATKRPLPIPPVIGGIIIILGLVTSYYFLKKASNEKKMKEAIKSRLKVVPKLNLESQQLELDIKIQPDFELRSKPVSEPGRQEVEVKGNFIIDERRIDE